MAIRAVVCRYNPGLKGIDKFRDDLKEEISNTLFRHKIVKVLKHGSVYKHKSDEDGKFLGHEYLGEIVVLKGPWVILKSIDAIWGESLLCGEFKEEYERLMNKSL